MSPLPLPQASSPAASPSTEETLIAARQLDEWNKMSSVVAHEINNPLAAIGNLIFLLQFMPGLPPEVTGVAQQITDELKRIEGLTRSALTFFRQGKGPEPVDLPACMDGIRLLLGPTLRERGVELEVQQQSDCTVHAWAIDARQALFNLVRNAVEATQTRGSKVTVSFEGRVDDVLFTVSDQGTGIDAQLQPRLFQLGATTKAGRSGVGLWLVRQLLDRYGATIQAESQPGQGARFVITWPRRTPETESTGTSSAGL